MPAKRTKKTAKKPVRAAKQARSLATVEAIIEATTRILASNGWSSVTTNTIAERAGVSVGSVYEYFRNKQAILDVIIDRHLSRGEALLLQSATEPLSPLRPDEVVNRLVSGFVSLHQDDPRLHKVLSAEVPLTKTQQARVDLLRSSIIEVVAAALAEHVSGAEMKAILLVDTADALSHRWLVDEVGTPVPAEVMSSELTKMLKLYAVS